MPREDVNVAAIPMALTCYARVISVPGRAVSLG
jgi:hypothetical protein